MSSNSDFQKIFDRYRKEGLPFGVSIVDFCSGNGVVYKQYERWLRHHQKIRIHPVQLTDMSQDVASGQRHDSGSGTDFMMPTNPLPLLFNLRLVASNGMSLQHRDLDYEHLLSLIKKLNVLC